MRWTRGRARAWWSPGRRPGAGLAAARPGIGVQRPLLPTPSGAWPRCTPRRWPVDTGAGITIGIVDTGVDVSHPDLAGRIGATTACISTGGDPAKCAGTGRRHRRSRHPRHGHRRGRRRQRRRRGRRGARRPGWWWPGVPEHVQRHGRVGGRRQRRYQVGGGPGRPRGEPQPRARPQPSPAVELPHPVRRPDPRHRHRVGVVARGGARAGRRQRQQRPGRLPQRPRHHRRGVTAQRLHRVVLDVAQQLALGHRRPRRREQRSLGGHRLHVDPGPLRLPGRHVDGGAARVGGRRPPAVQGPRAERCRAAPPGHRRSRELRRRLPGAPRRGPGRGRDAGRTGTPRPRPAAQARRHPAGPGPASAPAGSGAAIVAAAPTALAPAATSTTDSSAVPPTSVRPIAPHRSPSRSVPAAVAARAGWRPR